MQKNDLLPDALTRIKLVIVRTTRALVLVSCFEIAIYLLSVKWCQSSGVKNH